MSMHREPHPLDAASAERLLAGHPVADQDRLVGLLAAMAAPAQDDELGRQAVTRKAFLDARRVPVPAWRPRLARIRSVLARGLTVKVAVLCLVSGSTGGLALAAHSGSLPDPIQRHLPGHAAPSGGPAPPAGRSAPPYTLLAACRRYRNHDHGQRREALRHEADLGELVAALGGPDPGRADRFCTDLRLAWPDAAASGQPTPDTPASPTAEPHQSDNGNGQGNGAGAGSGTGAGNGAGSTSTTGASPARSGNRAGAPPAQPGNRSPNGRP
jgi:hypothetical protein